MTNIVLCGGNGTRLWPISRELMPKQFVKFFDNKSLFQLTIERNSKFCNEQIIVSNIEQYFLALDQLEEIKNSDNKYLLEAVGRNTAPAIALACMLLDPDEIVLVTPSDHLIKNKNEYNYTLSKAKELARKDYIITFGINPTYAETGFGYIEALNFDVKAFHEKPNIETAQKYLNSDNYYWNSGIFCFKAGVFLEELRVYSVDIYTQSLNALKNSIKNNNVIRTKYKDMLNIPNKSIDYAVLEKSKIIKVVPFIDIGWSDIGSFDALFEELPKDDKNNTVNKKYISINSRNNLIYGNDKYIATVDIENMIIVDTGDAILVSKKGSSDKIRKVVSEIKKNTQLHNVHLTSYRPWGIYTVLENSQGYKIKRIEVKPNHRLSLQKHKHRNEHWIVVSGVATVSIEDKIFLLNENESTYIKAGDTHRLSNNTNKTLVIIEVQVGSYLGEDDIIRFKDDYQRGFE